MDDFAFLCGTAAGAPADHHHDGYAHDEACLPARTFLHLQDLSDFSQLYGSGATPATHHHDEYVSHDDSCLLGSGCLGLGLDAGTGEKTAPPAVPLASGFEFLARHPAAPYQHVAASTGFLEAPGNNTGAGYPPAHFTPNPTLLDLETASLSLLSQVSPPRSPEHQPDPMSEDGAGSDVESHGSCGSQCPGSGGPCSSGTCDEATACRDENCSMPCVAPDVAHSAFILQGISGARQIQPELQQSDQNESSFQHAIEGPSMDYYLTGQARSFCQPAQYYFQKPNEWPHAPTDFVQNAQPGRRPDSPQGLPQSLDFPHYSPAPVDQEQSFGLTQPLGLDSNSTDFSMELPQNAQYSFEDASAQVYAQQTSPGAPTPSQNPDPNLPGPESSQDGWYQASLNGFQFNTSGLDSSALDTPPMDTAYGQSLLKTLSACTAAITTSDNAHSDYLTPANRSQNSPSKSLESLTDISSPTSDFAAHQDITVSDQVSAIGDVHVCQWRLCGDRVCGKRFDDKVLLHSHVAEAHVNVMEVTEDHGFICRWKGCDRLTNKKRESKRGFDTKSKIRRHMEVHTGPLEEHRCEDCGKLCASKQALNTHRVTHSEDRPYRCDIATCGKTFKTKDSLATHARNAHSDTKRYVCEICNKGFKDSSNFTKHKATHNNVKRYTCLQCGRGFCRRDQLFRHARKAYGMTDEVLKKLYPEAPRGARARTEKR